MTSKKFRRQLRQEAEKWWHDGLIDASLYEKLATRYQFQSLESEATNRFVAILISLGGILLGLGVITFVAANWQVWSKEIKVVLLLCLFIGVNLIGFHLWQGRIAQGRLRKLGHGLLLLGGLILGANMALMSQIFHQSGNLYELFLFWGLGIIVMAYSLRLTSLGVMAIILIVIGYWLGWFAWLEGDEFTWLQLVVIHLPLLASLLFISLAYWCRSRVIFVLGVITVAVSLVFNLRPISVWSGNLISPSWVVAIAFVLPPALLWSYHESVWQFSRVTPALTSSPNSFQPISRSVAVWFLAGLFYWFSFHWFWTDNTSHYYYRNSELSNWQPLIDVFFLSIFTGLGWLKIGLPLSKSGLFQEKAINSAFIAALLSITICLFFWHLNIAKLPFIATFLFNIMLFLFAVCLIRDGLSLSIRRTFWGGMSLLILGIFSRMLEYNTDLLLKALVFVLCGCGVIVAGLFFERNLKQISDHQNRVP